MYLTIKLMGLIFLFLILPVVVAGFAAYFVFSITRSRLKKIEHKRAKAISIVAFIASFLLFTCAIYILIISNISIGR
jgi:predicted PurR-regulated permease PerM